MNAETGGRTRSDCVLRQNVTTRFASSLCVQTVFCDIVVDYVLHKLEPRSATSKQNPGLPGQAHRKIHHDRRDEVQQEKGRDENELDEKHHQLRPVPEERPHLADVGDLVSVGFSILPCSEAPAQPCMCFASGGRGAEGAKR